MVDIKVRDVTLQLDLLDADVVERFESLLEKYRSDINRPEEGASNADEMRRQIRLTDQLLDDIFGEGSAAKVFEGVKPGNLMARLEAVADLSNASDSSEKQIQLVVDNVNNKYAQRAQNRQKRRRNKHRH